MSVSPASPSRSRLQSYDVLKLRRTLSVVVRVIPLISGNSSSKTRASRRRGGNDHLRDDVERSRDEGDKAHVDPLREPAGDLRGGADLAAQLQEHGIAEAAPNRIGEPVHAHDAGVEHALGAAGDGRFRRAGEPRRLAPGRAPVNLENGGDPTVEIVELRHRRGHICVFSAHMQIFRRNPSERCGHGGSRHHGAGRTRGRRRASRSTRRGPWSRSSRASYASPARQRSARR